MRITKTIRWWQSIIVMVMTTIVPNRVLGASPPNISRLESLLPRSVRTTLAQLCSGHCRLLNSYKARITSGISDVCPECGVAPHSVEHLFNCQSHPMQLTVQDLWDNLAAVADFLIPKPGQLTIGEEMLGYHNNNYDRLFLSNSYASYCCTHWNQCFIGSDGDRWKSRYR